MVSLSNQKDPSAEAQGERLGDPLPAGFWDRSTLEMARLLLGKVLVSEIGGDRTAGRVVETEGYMTGDSASHTFRGQTRRNAPMFGNAGTAYVYFTYGNHWCLNFVTGLPGVGEAVLIRALEPLAGLDVMQMRRGRSAPHELASGPGKLCQAMAVTGEMNFHPLDLLPLMLLDDGWDPGEIASRPRIGISTATDNLWRFYPVRSSAWVSRR